MIHDTPKFTPEQELANKWVADNWHTGLKISGTDTNFSSFYAFLAGYETAQSSSAARIEKLEGAMREFVASCESAPPIQLIEWLGLACAHAKSVLNPEETKGGGSKAEFEVRNHNDAMRDAFGDLGQG